MADKDVKIGAALAAATCSLLGIGPSVSVAAEAEPKWDIDSAILYYGESDGRVKDLSLSAHATRDFGDERRLGPLPRRLGLAGAPKRDHQTPRR